MAVLLSLLLLGAAAALAPPPPSAQCAAVQRRAPCGQPTDSPSACATKGCCYDAAGAAGAAVPCFYAGGDAVPITTVRVISACHFDAGYLSTTSDILNRWFHTFFPQALKLGLELDARGGRERLKFMAQSWIVSLFLDCPPGLAGLQCPNATEIADFETAVAKGYIYWHAFPFNGEPELLSPEMFAEAVALTHALDDRFGLPHKVTLSQRDVPGMTRAVVPALAAAGVKALSIGVNPWSTPPMVPRAFVWRDKDSGISMPAMLHPGYYGGINVSDAVILPGLSHALVFDWRGDNLGPPTSAAEVEANFTTIAAEFPGATVVASTFDDFTALLTPEVLAMLPVIESEIGDTWLHGAASDPLKSARSKRAAAARLACLAPGGACAAAGGASAPALKNFTRLLLKNAEHTWGESLGHYTDNQNWTNAQFAAARAASPSYAAEIMASWDEQRAYGLEAALQALQVGAGHPLAPAVAAAWADLVPDGAPALAGWAPLAPGAAVAVGPWALQFDAATGALAGLVDRGQSPPVAWTTAASGGGGGAASVGLGLAQYNTYSAPDVFAWEAAYNLQGPNREFGRDASFASAGTTTAAVAQRLLGLWQRNSSSSGGGASFLVRADFSPAELHTDYGAPAELYLQYDVPAASGAGAPINVTLTLLNKTATRLVEALFLRFNASCSGAAPAAWRVSKLGSWVDPFDVQPGGNQRHHGVDAGVAARCASGATLLIGAPDAPLAAFGAPTLFPVPVDAPADAREGASFLLSGQLWNTNYAFWYPWLPADSGLRLRFSLSSLPPGAGP